MPRWLVAIHPATARGTPPGARRADDVVCVEDFAWLAQRTSPFSGSLLYAWPRRLAFPAGFTFSSSLPVLRHFLPQELVEPALLSARDNSERHEHVILAEVDDQAFVLLELSLEGDDRACVSPEQLAVLGASAGQTKGGAPPR